MASNRYGIFDIHLFANIWTHQQLWGDKMAIQQIPFLAPKLRYINFYLIIYTILVNIAIFDHY